MRIADAASVSNAIEELQDLDRALSAELDRVAIVPRFDDVVLARERRENVRELVDAPAVVEEIAHDLMPGAAGDELAKPAAYLLFRRVHRGGEIAHPRRIEASGRNQRQHFLCKQVFVFGK